MVKDPQGSVSLWETGELTVGAAELRGALGVTPHQLGELTAGLRVDVGQRPNYPRYRRADVLRMAAVQALREIRVPLEVSLKAANDYHHEIVAGGGWLLSSPAEGAWATSFVRTGPDLVLWLRTVGGNAAVLDLDTVAREGEQAWLKASGVTRSGS